MSDNQIIFDVIFHAYFNDVLDFYDEDDDSDDDGEEEYLDLSGPEFDSDENKGNNVDGTSPTADQTDKTVDSVEDTVQSTGDDGQLGGETETPQEDTEIGRKARYLTVPVRIGCKLKSLIRYHTTRLHNVKI